MRTENTWASQPLSGITMISAIRYEVEIHPPSSMPAPMAPWMSASEALTIWMLSTAMKAPSMAAVTAIQVLSGTESALGTGAKAGAGIVVAGSAERRSADMARLLARGSQVAGVGAADEPAIAALRQHRRFGV